MQISRPIPESIDESGAASVSSAPAENALLELPDAVPWTGHWSHLIAAWLFGGVVHAGMVVFTMHFGAIKVVVLSEQGKKAVVGILEPGQFFGEGCLNGDPLRIFTTKALEECVITAITKTAMLAALRSEPQFC
jgi:Cyclic nucleotide-binding domain